MVQQLFPRIPIPRNRNLLFPQTPIIGTRGFFPTGLGGPSIPEPSPGPPDPRPPTPPIFEDLPGRGGTTGGTAEDDSGLIPLDEFLEQVLEEDPGLTFFSFQDQFGGSQNQQSFFQSGQGFDIAYNQFLGELGLALGGGQPGGLVDPNNVDLGNLPTFNQFLGQENFFGDLFQGQSRTTRGLFDANFAANPRVLFNLGG